MWCIWSKGDICPFVSCHVHTHMNPIITAFVHPPFPLPPSAPLKIYHCISLQYTLSTVIYTHMYSISAGWPVMSSERQKENWYPAVLKGTFRPKERERKKEKASTRLFTVILHLRSVNWYSEINIAGVSRPVQRATFTHYNHSHCVPATLAGLNVHLKCYIWLISFRHYHSVGSACWCTQTQKWCEQKCVDCVCCNYTKCQCVYMGSVDFFQDKQVCGLKSIWKLTLYFWHKSSDRHVNQKPL